VADGGSAFDLNQECSGSRVSGSINKILPDESALDAYMRKTLKYLL
jgi:hypothetical protein